MKWMLVDSGGVDRGDLGVVEANDKEAAIKKLAEFIPEDANAEDWDAINVTYSVQTEDGTIIGRYDTSSEALEAAVNEFKHQAIELHYLEAKRSPYYEEVKNFNYEHINEVLSCIENPFESYHPEDPWIYIKNDANDNGGWIICGGDIYDTRTKWTSIGNIERYDAGFVSASGMEA